MQDIVLNEWRYFLRTRFFLGISVAFVLILAISTVLGKYQIQKQKQASEDAQQHLREQWESIEAMNPHSAAHYGTFVFRPATLMNGLDDGVNTVLGNVTRVEGHVQNEMVYSEASQMQVASRFGKLRSSLLLQYMVPLLLIFLTFSSVSSEKTSGRLKLILLQGSEARRLMAAKTLAAWSYGLILLLTVILGHTWLHFKSISGDEALRTVFFFLAYALYYFIICGLTVYFSARWQNATAALTSMLAIWMIWTVFLPGILLSAAEKRHPLPSRKDFNAAMRQDRSQGLDGHNPADERSKELEQKVLAEYGVDSLAQLPINFDGILMQADEEYGNQVWDKHFGRLGHVLKKQKQLMQTVGLINPFTSLQNASMGFAGSDYLHQQEFLFQVENYRREFIKILNDKHAYGGSKTGDWGWKADNEFFRSVPDFQYRPVSILPVLGFYARDVGVLLIWALLAFFLLISAGRKMQVI